MCCIRLSTTSQVSRRKSLINDLEVKQDPGKPSVECIYIIIV